MGKRKRAVGETPHYATGDEGESGAPLRALPVFCIHPETWNGAWKKANPNGKAAAGGSD